MTDQGEVSVISTAGEQRRERLRQERETFDQHKSHQNRWFTLRLAMGYSAVLLLLAVFAVCVMVSVNHALLPSVIVTWASAAFFGDVVGLVVTVWKVVFNPDFMTQLAPLTETPRDAQRVGSEQRGPQEDVEQAKSVAILSAKYGAGDTYRDVTGILKAISAAASTGHLSLVVTNDTLGGDPLKGIIKELLVTYSYEGKTRSITVREFEELSLP
jgi:hypothetical protein